MLLIGSGLQAQFTRFPMQGTIEFEKKVNMHAILKSEITKDNEAYMTQILDQYKKTQPQFMTMKSTLQFSKDKSLFTPAEEPSSTASRYSSHPSVQQINTVFNDFATHTSSVQKKVFEQTFLIRDSIRNVKWKITDETREIAGYSCRRANGLILDSIYVVAFYTDQIPVASGPETFSGLPGMILGVALPHVHVTWFATSVTDKPLEKPLVSPTKGKATNYKGLVSTFDSLIKSYGEQARKYFQAFML